MDEHGLTELLKDYLGERGSRFILDHTVALRSDRYI
jgi:hypothetical protein